MIYFVVVGVFWLIIYLNCWRIMTSVLVEEMNWSVSTAFWAGMFWPITLIVIGIKPFNKMNMEWIKRNDERRT